MDDRPNVLFITCHDLGDYLGCYGTPVATPNLDAMASRGVVLENHFATATICCPSRGSLLTGCYPHTHELMGLINRGWELNVDRCEPLPRMLEAAGYETHLFGLQGEHWDPHRLGYREVHTVTSNFSDHVSPVFTEWLQTRTPTGRPFLANVGFFEPHRFGVASSGYRQELHGQLPSHFKRDEYDSADPDGVEVRPYLADVAQTRQELADFYGAVTFMDHHVGRVLQALDDAGLTDSTLVVFATDHGASFLHSKGTLYDGGTKVACLMHWPGVLPAGHRVRALTSHVDVLPSLLDLLELPDADAVQGQSFTSLARAEAGEGRRYVYAEKNYTQYYDPARMIRSNSRKYIRKGLNTCLFDFILTEIELSPASFRSVPAVARFYDAKRCTEELYDLDADPSEMNNLARDPDYDRVIAEMRAALDSHLSATDDPFRHLRNDLLMPTDVYDQIMAHSET